MKENPDDCRSNLKICPDLFRPLWLRLLFAIPPQWSGWGDKYSFQKSNMQALLKLGKVEPGRLKILIMYPGLPEKRIAFCRCSAERKSPPGTSDMEVDFTHVCTRLARKVDLYLMQT